MFEYFPPPVCGPVETGMSHLQRLPVRADRKKTTSEDADSCTECQFGGELINGRQRRSLRSNITEGSEFDLLRDSCQKACCKRSVRAIRWWRLVDAKQGGCFSKPLFVVPVHWLLVWHRKICGSHNIFSPGPQRLIKAGFCTGDVTPGITRFVFCDRFRLRDMVTPGQAS